MIQFPSNALDKKDEKDVSDPQIHLLLIQANEQSAEQIMQQSPQANPEEATQPEHSAMVIKEGSSTFMNEDQQVSLLKSKSQLADLLPDEISELSEGAQERAWNPDMAEQQE